MTLAELLASFEAQNGRDKRGINVSQSDLAKLEAAIMSQYGGYDFRPELDDYFQSRSNAMMAGGDNGLAGSQYEVPTAARDPQTGQLLYFVNPGMANTLEFGAYRDTDNLAHTALRGRIDPNTGGLIGLERYVPTFDGGLKARQMFGLSAAAIAGGAAMGLGQGAGMSAADLAAADMAGGLIPAGAGGIGGAGVDAALAGGLSAAGTMPYAAGTGLLAEGTILGGGAAAAGSGATGAAASGAGGLLSQLGQGASTVGGFLRDNASWLAPLAGGVAGYLGTDSDVAPYTGQMSAEWTPAQQQGLDMMQAAAGNAPQVQAQMQGLLSQATAQNPMFGLENPGLTGAIDRAQQDLSRNYNTLVAPKFSMGSSFGSSGLGELEALARKDVTDAMANIGTQMRYQNYGLQANLGEAQANRAMQGVSAAGNIGMYPTQVGTGLMNAGAAQQQSNQAALDRQYQEFVRTNQPQGNPWAGALGGAMLGSQLGGFLQQPQVQAPNYMPTSYRPQAWNGVAS